MALVEVPVTVVFDSETPNDGVETRVVRFRFDPEDDAIDTVCKYAKHGSWHPDNFFWEVIGSDGHQRLLARIKADPDTYQPLET